jgi:hypothetical protein
MVRQLPMSFLAAAPATGAPVGSRIARLKHLRDDTLQHSLVMCCTLQVNL